MQFDQIRRRQFIMLLGGTALAWPARSGAQQPSHVPRVGVLSNVEESDPEAQSMVATLNQTLRELGWLDDRNIRIDHRWAAGNATRLADLAKQLVAAQPGVLVAHLRPGHRAIQRDRGHIDRIHPGCRSDRQRFHHRSGASGREYCRLQQFRTFNE